MLAQPTINLVMPVYNEEAVLEKNISLLKNYLQINLANYDWQIIIVDNNSTDQTSKIGRHLAEQTRIKYFFIPQKGRGLALRRTFLNYQADYHVYMDIDLATDLAALPELIKYLDLEKYDLVIGSRFHKKSKISRSILREIISRSYMFLAKLIVGTKTTDLQCGFKGLNRKIVQEIIPQTKDQQWFFDSELVFLTERSNLKIAEVPVNWIETRNIGRKSKVKLIKSILEFLQNLINFRKKYLK